MSLYPEDDTTRINEKFEKIQNDKQVSDVDPNLNLSHELPQEKEERERQEKEAKAKALVEGMQAELKSYIDSQMSQIPQLINQNIQQGFQQIMPQLQQQGIPTGDNSQDKIAALQALAPVLQGLFNRNEPQGQSISDQIVGMILNGHMKKMQMDIDSQYMSTYQQPVNPPQWQRENQNPNQTNLRIE